MNNMSSEEFNKLTEEEQIKIETQAIVRTANNLLVIICICPNCHRAYITRGYVCTECGYDNSDR